MMCLVGGTNYYLYSSAGITFFAYLYGNLTRGYEFLRTHATAIIQIPLLQLILVILVSSLCCSS